MEEVAISRTKSTLEEQLNRLVKAIIDATRVAEKEMMKSSQVEKVRTKLDSLYNVILKRSPEEGGIV